MLKGQNGVTLISLVVTIIVLLILTGVSLSMVLGQNGVLTQASTAVVEQTKADVTEKVATALTSIETEYKGAWAKDTSIKRDEYYTLTNLEDQFTGEIKVYDVTAKFYSAAENKDASQWTLATIEEGKDLQIPLATGALEIPEDEDDLELETNHLYLIMLTESGSTSFALVSFADKKMEISPRINGEKQSRAAGSTYVSYIDIGDEEIAEYYEKADGDIAANTLVIVGSEVENIVIDWTPVEEDNG